jgi:predicted small lipoprotein YifL
MSDKLGGNEMRNSVSVYTGTNITVTIAILVLAACVRKGPTSASRPPTA